MRARAIGERIAAGTMTISAVARSGVLGRLPSPPTDHLLGPPRNPPAAPHCASPPPAVCPSLPPAHRFVVLPSDAAISDNSSPADQQPSAETCTIRVGWVGGGGEFGASNTRTPLDRCRPGTIASSSEMGYPEATF